MSKKNPAVEACFSDTEKWHKEFKKLRTIIHGFPLAEELKWGKPCYTFNGSNLLIIQGFKEYCALMFCKGALLKDAQGQLVAPGENTQSARQMRFTEARQIKELEPVLKAYIEEAIAAEQAGLKVEFKKSTNLVYPAELQQKLDENPAFKAAFEALTPGRRRAYNLHFSQARQSATRASRIEKCLPDILRGKGLNDR